MPMIPEILQSDINIAQEYVGGFDVSRCETGLWGIYSVIKKMASDVKALECLYMIGVNGAFGDGDLLTLVYSGKTNKKYKRGMPAAANLFRLEKYGFAFDDLFTTKPGTPQDKLAVKDITRFTISYAGGDYPDVIFGLKLFADVCMKQAGDCFYTGDVRVTFAGALKPYAPPVEEVFCFLLEDQKELAYAVHNKLANLGCVRSLERSYMTKYAHPKSRGQVFATIYAAEHLWFLPESERRQKLTFKLNLRNIGKYADYLSECTDSVSQSILGTDDCWMGTGAASGGCGRHCGGIVFEYQGKRYVKCLWYAFRFFDLSGEAQKNYIRLIELESECLGKTTKPSCKGGDAHDDDA